MESFRFSHYPLSTRRPGKRALSSNELSSDDGLDQEMEMSPQHSAKRRKTEEAVAPATPPTNALVRPKRHFSQAFSPATPLQQEIEAESRRQIRRVVSSCQSAGQITMESPLKEPATAAVAAAAVPLPPRPQQPLVMNSLLGQLHAERQQRQHKLSPLTDGLHAMSLQGQGGHSAGGVAGRKKCVSLQTNSKLG